MCMEKILSPELCPKFDFSCLLMSMQKIWENSQKIGVSPVRNEIHSWDRELFYNLGVFANLDELFRPSLCIKQWVGLQPV